MRYSAERDRAKREHHRETAEFPPQCCCHYNRFSLLLSIKQLQLATYPFLNSGKEI